MPLPPAVLTTLSSSLFPLELTRKIPSLSDRSIVLLVTRAAPHPWSTIPKPGNEPPPPVPGSSSRWSCIHTLEQLLRTTIPAAVRRKRLFSMLPCLTDPGPFHEIPSAV